MLDWMIANANKGYFKNLKYFAVNEHNIQACVDPAEAEALQTAILADLKTICEDTVNFPMLSQINLDNNGYNEGGSIYQRSQFADALLDACTNTSRAINISAWTDMNVVYPNMCGSTNSSYSYYDLNDEREITQCRFTWHWELKSGYRQYGDKGPFPDRHNPRDCSTEPTTQSPTQQPTTKPTVSPTNQPTTPPMPTPTATPTPEPWFPVYDPFILGDNCNYESQDTCYFDVIKDDVVTELYLKVRDAYPTKALAHTRVLALAGMTQLSLNLWHESLSKQVKNEAPIDMYIYGDVLLSRMIDAMLIPGLLELTQYTYPSRLVFVYGTFKREGFKEMLDWMIANANKGYFKNLKYFQVSEHNIQACVNEEDADSLEESILDDLKTICEDKVNFPLLSEMNFDNNGYNVNGTEISQFAVDLTNACSFSTSVTVSAWTNSSVVYPNMCGSRDDSYSYYDLEDYHEVEQCRFTWHWELKSGTRQYGDKGPFPNRNNPINC